MSARIPSMIPRIVLVFIVILTFLGQIDGHRHYRHHNHKRHHRHHEASHHSHKSHSELRGRHEENSREHLKGQENDEYRIHLHQDPHTVKNDFDKSTKDGALDAMNEAAKKGTDDDKPRIKFWKGFFQGMTHWKGFVDHFKRNTATTESVEALRKHSDAYSFFMKSSKVLPLELSDYRKWTEAYDEQYKAFIWCIEWLKRHVGATYDAWSLFADYKADQKTGKSDADVVKALKQCKKSISFYPKIKDIAGAEKLFKRNEKGPFKPKDKGKLFAKIVLELIKNPDLYCRSSAPFDIPFFRGYMLGFVEKNKPKNWKDEEVLATALGKMNLAENFYFNKAVHTEKFSSVLLTEQRDLIKIRQALKELIGFTKDFQLFFEIEREKPILDKEALNACHKSIDEVPLLGLPDVDKGPEVIGKFYGKVVTEMLAKSKKYCV